MKSSMNIYLLTAEEVIRWAEPETQHESLLFEALKETLEKNKQLQIDTNDSEFKLGLEIGELKARVEELEKENNEQDSELTVLRAENAKLEAKLANVKELVAA